MIIISLMVGAQSGDRRKESYMTYMELRRYAISNDEIPTYKAIGDLMEPSKKSHHVLDKYPTMHHSVTEMYTYVHISVTKWYIMGYGTVALWDSSNRSNNCQCL